MQSGGRLLGVKAYGSVSRLPKFFYLRINQLYAFVKPLREKVGF
jgi:hypothetical protein